MIDRRRFCALVVALSSACLLKTQAPPKAVRQRAPAFVLPDQDGRAVSLEGLTARGPAVIVFYRGHW